jgi:hypothetical protein
MNKEIEVFIYDNGHGNSISELEKGKWINVFPENSTTPVDKRQMIKAKLIIPMPEPKGEITVSQFAQIIKDIECTHYTMEAGRVIDKWYKTLFGDKA